MTAAAMLSRESRQWGYRDDDDGEEEVVEVVYYNEIDSVGNVVSRRQAVGRS